jgi:hypothetical protein
LPEREQQNPYDYLYKFDPEIFRVETLKEVARKKSWITSVAGPLFGAVERDILAFDSFAALAELSGDQLAFGGGTLLNWVYARETPRFSFDIDSQLRKSGFSKAKILSSVVEPLNHKLRKLGKLKTIEYGKTKYEIGAIVFDAEKDHFEDVLSLKRPVFALHSGSPANVYMRKEVSKLERDSGEEGRRLKEYFGGKLPKIEDVRVEIGIPRDEEGIYPSEETDVRPLVYPEIGVDSVRARVTQKEYIIASKIFKLGKRFESEEEVYAIPDFVKSICDLYFCAEGCNANVVFKHLERISEINGYRCQQVVADALTRLRKLSTRKEASNWFKTSGQTSFIAQSKEFKDLIAETVKLLDRNSKIGKS